MELVGRPVWLVKDLPLGTSVPSPAVTWKSVMVGHPWNPSAGSGERRGGEGDIQCLEDHWPVIEPPGNSGFSEKHYLKIQ